MWYISKTINFTQNLIKTFWYKILIQTFLFINKRAVKQTVSELSQKNPFFASFYFEQHFAFNVNISKTASFIKKNLNKTCGEFQRKQFCFIHRSVCEKNKPFKVTDREETGRTKFFYFLDQPYIFNYIASQNFANKTSKTPVPTQTLMQILQHNHNDTFSKTLRNFAKRFTLFPTISITSLFMQLLHHL